MCHCELNPTLHREMITARLAPEYIPRLPTSTQSAAVNTPTPLSTSGGSMYVGERKLWGGGGGGG